MTKPEITGMRDLTFSGWIRENLPDSKTGYLVSDLDWIICNYKTKILVLLEVKTRNKKLPEWQNRLFKNIDRWLKKGIDDDWIYLGYHTVIFTNTFFNDGDVYFDKRKVTEEELISILSFQ